MFDSDQALQDMARQIRSCRSEDGLTLQQLAQRSGVAASTIHKVEARQMVPTVSVLLKIAKGLGRRPEELIRDGIPSTNRASEPPKSSSPEALPCDGETEPGVWRIHLDANQSFPAVELSPLQRAIVLVEEGAIELRAGERLVQLVEGQCIEVEGGSIESHRAPNDSTRLTLIASPPDDLAACLGVPGNFRAAWPSPRTP